MITGAYHFLKERPDLLAAQRSRIRFLLVDEFQDVNFAQIEILALLAGGDPNPDLFVVGDPDQAIYMFRGASSEAFSLFAERFPSAKVVRLVKNRRSLAPILQCAFGIVNENPNPPVFGHRRARLDSWREEQAQERSQPLPLQPVEIVTWGDKDVEASDVAGRIQKLRRELHCDWREFTVLYRQHNHRDELVKELAERNIPFVIEGLDVLDTPEVRDVVACLSAAVNPNDGAALFRVAALPQFSIDAPALKSGMRSAPRGGLDLVAILGKISGGPEVLAAVENAQSAISADTVLAVPALNIVLRTFALPRTAALSSFFEFAERWQKSPATENRRAAEFLEYLGYFRQAKGSSVPLSPSKEDGVRLMTAHATKGLEFDHVVILRGASITFPCVYREPVVDFPRELRRSHPTLSDKELYEQEERRLYYVAMTRARDTLAIYAKQGTGTNKRPTKFLREFMSSPAYRSFWREREAGAVQDELFGAAEEERIAIQRSNVAAWLLTASPAGFTDHLSATAIETYEQCPLRFKLQTEWNLPRDAPAALQYGASMHRVLHTFYQARQMGREISDEHLLENFRADFASAGLPDRYQYELYLRQGREQLIQFLAWARSSPSPEVLHTEQPFELSIAGIQFTGRIDRIDRIEGADGKSVSIVDYKTGRPKSQDDADKSLQLSLYALAARRVWGLRADRLILHNLEDNTAAVTTRLDAELAQAEERVRAAAEGIAAGDFHAEPGRQCGLCPYRNLCPATEKVVHLPQKKTIRQAS
jgi:DNA helicase-2/ATP-dependent DNA helicase PcrA